MGGGRMKPHVSAMPDKVTLSPRARTAAQRVLERAARRLLDERAEGKEQPKKVAA